MQTIRCSKCSTELPATTTHFYMKKSGKFGLYSICIQCCKEYYKQQYEKKKSLILENRREYRSSEKGQTYLQHYMGTENYKMCRQKYKQSEKGKISTQETRKRRRSKYKLSLNMSSGMSRALKGNKSGKHWETLVPYTLNDLKQHLESLFQIGMTWDNYGKWHVDHKIPQTYFNFVRSEDEGFQDCWALYNLQPLWAIDNIKKSNKLVY